MHPILNDLQRRYPDLAGCLSDIEAAFDLMRQTYQSGGKVLICGNGGSAADSDHWVGELMKGFERRRPINHDLRQQLANLDLEQGTYIADHLQGALPTIALTGQIALETAFSNDVAGDLVFAQQVYGLGGPGDTLIGISTSGNSANVLHALFVAKVLGLHTIGLTGKSGGKMPALCDVTIRVPYERTLEVQERHLPVYHALSIMLEQEFFNE